MKMCRKGILVRITFLACIFAITFFRGGWQAGMGATTVVAVLVIGMDLVTKDFRNRGLAND